MNNVRQIIFFLKNSAETWLNRVIVLRLDLSGLHDLKIHLLSSEAFRTLPAILDKMEMALMTKFCLE